ncbi:uncharacterized protein LY89DRAFT_47192 [Mollisia scopiformis]|uniref:Zn(2)-C6 fungal-type domain-containing protein n=1 Tax=Mollisia scopiformis TaxID=149040 RepID=A0A194XE07_MOLSC|nr:uncharacterized protein LY89DRAFT_47192 [Mollisia scopiformis]KUJ18384.1 hypothetical protein LY89DRAFT_47192 [Mollisia scopiformis]
MSDGQRLATGGEGFENQHVHPSSSKRRKKDEDRTRVTRACDRCKRKKTRCTGKQPCTLCTQANLSCEFTAAYNRGRLPSVIPDDNVREILPEKADTRGTVTGSPGLLTENQRAQYAGMELLLQASLPNAPVVLSPEPRPNTLVEPMAQVLPTGQQMIDSRMHSSRNSPEPSQTDLQGHYVGPASGVSFLLRVQKKLHQKVSFSQSSSIFTFGDAPLPDFNPSFFILPSQNDAEKLVARYFDFAVPTHRFLHQPTIETWLQEFYENLGVMRGRGAGERTAVLFMVMAQAKDYMPDQASTPADTSARYFQAADHQLSTETGEIRLTSVQARLCQCFYLLSQSRVNHCWSLFGTTAHLILAIGIHRKRRVETSNGSDLIDLECRKRVFWCAYSLDNYLSAALGRPRTFHDDDIDQDFPTCVNDAELTSQKMISNISRAQSIMVGPIAHARLSRIVSNILRDLYAIRAPSPEARVTLTAKYSAELLSWREGLSRFLGTDGVDSSLLLPVYQRQRNVLNLAYQHALILVHRPFLLSNFASLSGKSSRQRGAPGTPDMDRKVSACLDAAMNIVTIVNDLAEGKQIFRAFWFTQYFAFCAVVVLYVYTIQQRNSPRAKYLAYFQAAAKCQAQISSMAIKESLAQRYSVVLEELRLEAMKQTERLHESNANVPSNSLDSISGPQTTNANGTSLHDIGGLDFSIPNDICGSDGPSGATPSSLMAELTDWSSFNSLVTAGMGNLDFLFQDDQIQHWEMSTMNDVGGVLLP